MNKDSCFKLGYITKVHGLKGDVIAFFDVDHPEYYFEMESVFVEINQQLVPFFIEELRPKQQKSTIVKFEDIETVQQANEMVGKNLYLPLEMLPEREEGILYYEDVISYKVEDKNSGTLGVITEFFEMPGQDLLSMDYQGKEVLIPVNDDLILNADHEKKILYVELPEGLVDLYINEDDSKESDEEE